MQPERAGGAGPYVIVVPELLFISFFGGENQPGQGTLNDSVFTAQVQCWLVFTTGLFRYKLWNNFDAFWPHE